MPKAFTKASLIANFKDTHSELKDDIRYCVDRSNSRHIIPLCLKWSAELKAEHKIPSHSHSNLDQIKARLDDITDFSNYVNRRLERWKTNLAIYQLLKKKGTVKKFKVKKFKPILKTN
jgi:cupin superfamily acireductone dioxygenase involved in methionine salvage